MSDSELQQPIKSTPLIAPRKPKELARDCPLDIFLSGHDGGGHGATYWPWAYRMDRVGEAGETYVNDCDEFVLDSAISDPSVTNDDVVATAQRLQPDYVVAADVLFNQEQTTERVIEFLDMLDDAGVDATPIIPLQPSAEGRADHGQHYLEMEGLGARYAVGGVKDAPAETKRDAVESVREVAGGDVDLHGLGFGAGYFRDSRVLDELLLDSIDCSGPIQQARSGSYWWFDGGRIVKQEVPRPKGKHVLTQIAVASGLTLLSLARLVMAEDPEPADLRETGQSGLEEIMT